MEMRRAMSVEDPLLVSRLRAKEPEALSAVVKEHLNVVFRVARGAGLGKEEAEDAAQETFKTFFEIASRFEGRSKVRTFLLGILFKKIAETRRARQKDLRTEPIDEAVESRFRNDGSWLHPPRPVDLQMEDAETGALIDDCLRQVPVYQRIAFALRDVVGFATEEICAIMEIQRTNLGVLLFRARNRLRDCLEARGIRDGAGAIRESRDAPGE